jgi:SepF-like predicted cell division protein (DUF552 family)
LPDDKKKELYLKTISIYDLSQLSKLQQQLIAEREHTTILIVRITPVVSKNPEEATKLINQLYSKAIEIGYCIFRLGDERIIIAPSIVQVEGILA